MVALLSSRRTARQIITRHSLENAVTVLYACGGSTNCVLHLLAIAHEVCTMHVHVDHLYARAPAGNCPRGVHVHVHVHVHV